MDKKDLKFGGCSCKLDPFVLDTILSKIPKRYDENLIVGFDDKDDASVYKISDDIAIVNTLDFFTRIVDDPFIFGKIAATNALSDIYAMGADVLTALSIACFPEDENPKVLSEILRGAALKIHECNGVLSGGHTVNDTDIKFGLSVTGVVNPNKIIKNNTCKIGDDLILTKPLGVGIVTTAYKVNEGTEQSYSQAIKQMETLNKYAIEIAKKYNINACTDVTGFGFLGHLNEMITNEYSISVDSNSILYIDGAIDFADEFLITAAGQKNRNYIKNDVVLNDISFAISELLFDPQTSGGLLISVSKEQSQDLLKELNTLDIKSSIVGNVINRLNKNIYVN